MRALIQRVSRASVVVDAKVVGSIGCGLLVFLAVEKNDQESNAESMAKRLLAYRVFQDQSGRMNQDLRQVSGGLLLVPQFTLAADTSRGLRPSFSAAAPVAQARDLYQLCLNSLRELHSPVEAGVFGAYMEVGLVNEGPVTFLLSC